MENLWQDLKHGAYIYAKSPLFTAVAIITIMVGIGASTAVFSVVDTILLKPLPYTNPDSIVLPLRQVPHGLNLGYSEIHWGRIEFQFFLEHAKAFRELGAIKADTFNITGAGDPVRVPGLRVSSGFFPVLGISPALGRIFVGSEDQPGHEHEVILSHQLWRQRFNSDKSILGHSVDLNGDAYTVIGVMPSGFVFPRAEEMPRSFNFPREIQLWVPLALPPGAVRGEPAELAIVGQLKSGNTLNQAQSELNLLGKDLERQYPQAKGWFESRVIPLSFQVAGDVRRPLLLILGSVGIVLLIACSNVSNLLLARSLGRRREFTLRVALGASRSRLITQLLAESLLFSFVAGILGFIFAAASLQLLKVLGPPNIPRLREIGIDFPMFLFAFGVTLITSVLFGLTPATEATRNDLIKSLRESGQKVLRDTSSQAIRKTLLVTQVAFALVLVIAAGLLTQTFLHLLHSNPGFSTQNVATFELTLPSSKYASQEQMVSVYRNILERLKVLPGLESAAIVGTVPMKGSPDKTLLRIPGLTISDPHERPIANYSVISPGYFSALGTPILQGRDFLESDVDNSLPVAIINSAMAKKFWPGVNPIGKQIGTPTIKDLAMIVGIVADVKHLSVIENAKPEMYVPFTQKVWTSMLTMSVVARSRKDITSIMGSVETAVHSVDPDLPLSNISTMESVLGDSLVQQRLAAFLLIAFAAISLLLAAIGVYGVISYSVAQQTQEIGVRIALGARHRNVFSMVLGQGVRLASLGIIIGLVASLGVVRLMGGFLYGVPSFHLPTFACVALMFMAVAMLSSYIPARRATRVAPTVALRCE
ncbi:MAG: ABC transporter permease [Terriglobales bacterium]